MKRMLPVLVLVLLVARVPAAQASEDYDAGEASRFVASLATMASIARYEPGLTVSSRRERLLNTMAYRLAFGDIGRFAMGRHWRHATVSERLELERLFQTVLPEISLDRLGKYLDPNLHVEGTIRMAGAGSEHDAALVRSVWYGGIEPVSVDWRVERRAWDLKITDVFVNGFSMAHTWREYLARSAQDDGPRGIIDQLHLEYERVAGSELSTVALTSDFPDSWR